MIENQEGFSRDRFNQTIALFDTANSEDPNQDEGQPKELLYAQRMSDMIARFAPEVSEASQLAGAHWQIVWRGRGIIHDHEPETTENQRTYGCPVVYHRFVSDCERPVSFPDRKDAIRVFTNPPDKSACVPPADKHLCRNGSPLPKDTVFQHAKFSNSRHISPFPGCSWFHPDTGNAPLPIDLWHNIIECVPVIAPSFPGIILLTVGRIFKASLRY